MLPSVTAASSIIVKKFARATTNSPTLMQSRVPTLGCRDNATMSPYRLLPVRSQAAARATDLAAMQGIMFATWVGASIWIALYALLAR